MHEAGSLREAELRRVLATLCVTEITSWGVLYYAFPVLAGEISRTTGWSAAAVTAGFSVGQLAAALAGIPVGRWLDRVGPRWLMTGGSLLAAPALVLVATAQNLAWFVAAWAVAGLAMGATLYPPAFAALTRWYGPRRVAALTVLTLAGGLASTVFAPLTALLDTHLDWREVYLVLAALLAVITVPGHLWGLRGPWPEPRDHATPARHHDPGRVARSPAFALLVLAFGLTAFATYAVVINLVPLLTERGLSPGTAAVALGLGGVGQVLGRIGYAAVARRTSVRARTALVVGGVALTTAILGLAASTPVLIAAAVLAGVARGVFTLLHATAVTDRWGAAHYGRLTGLMSAPLAVTAALAPWAGAAIAGHLGGHSLTFLLLAALAGAAALLAPATVPGETSPEEHRS